MTYTTRCSSPSTVTPGWEGSLPAAMLGTWWPTVDEHTILVAFTVEAGTREEAHEHLTSDFAEACLLSDSNYHIQEWWVAEDDRQDGSDNDSAVFVHPGGQAKAVQVLRNFKLTAECNLTQGATSNWKEVTPT